MHTYIYFPQKELTPDGRDAVIWKLLTLLNTPGRGCTGLECFGAKRALFGRHRHHRLVSHQVMPDHLMAPKLTEEWLSVPLRLHPQECEVLEASSTGWRYHSKWPLP